MDQNNDINNSTTDKKAAEKQRSDANNTQNVKNAAEVAMASKNPYAMAAGAAVKVGDKLTGGGVSKGLGKAITNVNKHTPLGKTVQKTSNKLAESGVSDAIGNVASMKMVAKAAALKKNSDIASNTSKAANTGSNVSTNSTSPKNDKNSSDALQKTQSGQKATGNVKNEKSNKKPSILLIIVIIVLVLLIIPILLLLIIMFLIFGMQSNVATGGYYPIECEDVTVILVDDNYQVIGNATYPLDEYVAGVINNEVGMFGNLEVYKQFAIAARTFFLRNQDNCTLEASDRRQTFSEVTESTPNGDLMKQAAEETKGMVLLDENDMLINSEYDAFCSIGVDNNYYTIKQQNQKIPKNWVDSQRGIAEEWKQGDCSGNHGRGMSQWGSYYLATEEDYTYEELIEYYLGTEKVSISSKGFISSVAGLEIKDTNNASYKLDQPLSSFLQSKGSSLATYNNFIKESVKSVGAGTREGVVAAAVSSINYLYDNFNTKLPYYWGGHHSGSIGIPERFGYNSPSTPSPSGKRYPYVSFDCSGFVNWAIENGGYNFANTNSYSDSGRFDSCNITDSSCKGQPGDLIDSPSHVVMIVSVDEANNNYYVAESTVSGVIMQTRGMHTNWGETTKIVKMDSFYNNKSNINSNY